MAIIFKVIPRRNPRDIEAPEKFYAAVTANGSVDFDVLAEMISEQSALSESDCLAMLNILETNIVRELSQGRIVRLGKLGNFQISISSEGHDTAEEVSSTSITKGRVLFRPSVKLRKLLGDLKYRQVS